MNRKMLAAGLLTTVTVLGGAGVAAASTGTGTGTGSGADGIPAQSVIHFARGATSATVKGHVNAGEDDRYVFDAQAGQSATFHLTRANSGQTWTLVGPTGPTGPAVHDAHSSRQSDFTYRLPETGRYYIDVTTTRPGNYRMSVAIPAGTHSGNGVIGGSHSNTGGNTGTSKPAVAEATRIDFARGATTATVSAQVGPQQRAAYTFAAAAGQRARIQLSGSPTAAFTLIAPTVPPCTPPRPRTRPT